MTSVLILLSGFDPGTYIIEDDGIPNNGIAQLRGPTGSVIFFNIPTEFLQVTASAGRSVIFNLTESFGAADIIVGSLTTPADNPDSIALLNIRGAGDVTLAASGAITELGSDAPVDIKANTLILSAGTGIGTAGNAIEVQVNTLEAETSTGGINLYNFGNVTVGGLTDDVIGLRVDTSGDLKLTSSGSILLSEESPGGFESVHGGTTSGNVTLIAQGATSDISSSVDRDSIAAPGGSIVLTAGRDVSFGTLGLNFDNDIRARDDLIITTGRDLNVDGFADFASDGFGTASGGDVIVNAARDINVLNSTGTDASIGAEGSGSGNVILNTGPGGFVRLLATSTSVLFASTGDVVVNADRMLIAATAGITASAVGHTVELRPKTSGWVMDLGSVTDGAFALELSDAELDRIFTPKLTLGGSTAGEVRVSAAISPAAAANLTLRSGTDVLFGASVTVSSSLTVFAGDNAWQTAASVITAPTFAATVDVAGDDGGIGGAGTFLGTITASSLPTLTGGVEGDVLNGSAASEILIGGGGIDVMAGGAGDDRYYVDNSSDVVTEAVAQGNDLVLASVSYMLASGQSVESLGTTDMTGVAPIILVGNDVANIIVGNAGANTLDGGGGVDVLQGLGGDDRYYVDSAADQALETVGQGNDLLLTSVSYTLSPTANIESLTVQNQAGVEAINITDNDLSHIVVGNAGANVLLGLGGSDILDGLGGADLLYGSLGNDQLIGGAGADQLVFDSPLNAVNNVDNITGFAPVDDTIVLDRDVFSGILANGTLAASAFVTGAAAGDADDRIVYNSATGQIFYDADGSGAGAQILFANIAPATALTNADFFAIA